MAYRRDSDSLPEISAENNEEIEELKRPKAANERGLKKPTLRFLIPPMPHSVRRTKMEKPGWIFFEAWAIQSRAYGFFPATS